MKLKLNEICKKCLYWNGNTCQAGIGQENCRYVKEKLKEAKK